MNEEAQKVLAGLLQRAVDGIDAATEFSQAQIPDIVQQLLVWKFVESLVYCVLAVAIVVSWAVVANKLWVKFAVKVEEIVVRKKAAKEAYNKGESWTRSIPSSHYTSWEYDQIMSEGPPDNRPLAIGLCIASGLLGLVSLSCLNFTWLKIWLAPKLYLIEYATHLIK